MWWTLNCGLFTSSPFKNVAQNWCPHLKTWVQPGFRQDEAKHGVLNNELLIADQQQVGVSVRDQFQPCEPSWDASLLGSWSTRHGWRSRGSCQSPLPGTRPDFSILFWISWEATDNLVWLCFWISLEAIHNPQAIHSGWMCFFLSWEVTHNQKESSIVWTSVKAFMLQYTYIICWIVRMRWINFNFPARQVPSLLSRARRSGGGLLLGRKVASMETYCGVSCYQIHLLFLALTCCHERNPHTKDSGLSFLQRTNPHMEMTWSGQLCDHQRAISLQSFITMLRIVSAQGMPQ